MLSEQSLDTLLDRIADTLAELIPYDALHIYEADLAPARARPRVRARRWADEIIEHASRFGEGITGWAVEHRSPVLANEAHLDPRVKFIPGTPPDPEALITVPLIARGPLKGALNIYRDRRGRVVRRGRVRARPVVRRRRGTRARQRPDPRAPRAPGADRLADRPLQPPLLPRAAARRAQRAGRAHDSVALLMFDIDDFKRVNDICGHGDGDQVLRRSPTCCRSTVRASDVVCRVGGEEFAVILPSCTAGDALGLARRA